MDTLTMCTVYTINYRQEETKRERGKQMKEKTTERGAVICSPRCYLSLSLPGGLSLLF